MTDNEESCLVYAARYAHHRRTAAAMQVVNNIIAKWDDIDPRVRKLIVRESREATHNHDDWQKLVDLIGD